MLPLQLSWMPFSLGQSYVGYCRFAFTLYLFLDSSAARGVLSRRGVGRLRHLSCRILCLQDLVSQKLLQVKAVLGTINPADISTKRLSVARLESLAFLLGIWSCSSNQLVGSEGPGKIFRHLSTSTSHTGRISQLQLLVSALSLLTVQLQGCSKSVDTMSNHTPDVPSMFLVTTWLGLLGAYVFWLAQPSKSGRRVAENPNFEDVARPARMRLT